MITHPAKTHTVDVGTLAVQFLLINGHVVPAIFKGSAVWNTHTKKVDVTSVNSVFDTFLIESNKRGCLQIEPGSFVPFSFVHRIVTTLSVNNIVVTEA